MQLIKLEKQDYEIVKGLDPLGLLLRAELSGGIVIAAVEQEDNSDVDVILGIAICTKAIDSLIIQWIAVDENEQARGVGDELLFELFTLARECGKKYLKAYFPISLLGDDFTDSAIDYFQCHGFEYEKKLLGEWLFGMKEFASEFEIDLQQRPDWIVSLRSTFSEKKQEYFEELSKERCTSYCFYDSFEHGKYNEELSFFLVGDRERLKGALLVEFIDYTIYPTVFYSDNEDTAFLLLGNLLLAIREKYGSSAEKMSICMIFTEGDSKLLKAVMPKNKTDNYFLISEL